VRRWGFVPGYGRDGSAVRVVLEVPMRFRLH
jgi:hypothetical protein